METEDDGYMWRPWMTRRAHTKQPGVNKTHREHYYYSLLWASVTVQMLLHICGRKT